MPTLILPFRHKPDFTSLWLTALKMEWKTVRWPLRPPFPALEGDLVLYADPLTAAVLKEEAEVDFPVPALDWLVQLPAEYVQRRVAYGTLGDLKTLTQGWAGPWFIKPARLKIFTAAVYESLEEPVFRELEADTEILISAPVNFTQEWRFFIGNRKVEAWSIYARNGEPFEDVWRWEEEEEREAKTFIEKFIADGRVHLEKSQVVDIGKHAGGWAVIETNEACASGLYGCEPEGVLRALGASARRGKMTNDE